MNKIIQFYKNKPKEVNVFFAGFLIFGGMVAIIADILHGLSMKETILRILSHEVLMAANAILFVVFAALVCISNDEIGTSIEENACSDGDDNEDTEDNTDNTDNEHLWDLLNSPKGPQKIASSMLVLMGVTILVFMSIPRLESIMNKIRESFRIITPTNNLKMAGTILLSTVLLIILDEAKERIVDFVHRIKLMNYSNALDKDKDIFGEALVSTEKQEDKR